MSNSQKIIDQPIAAREIIFAARLKELMDETGVQLAIATVDAVAAPRVQKQPTVSKTVKVKKGKK